MASYILLVLQKFSLEPGFSQGTDPLWKRNKQESINAAELRAQKLVDRIFKFEPRDKICENSQHEGWVTLMPHP